jgi:hypothetical protein
VIGARQTTLPGGARAIAPNTLRGPTVAKPDRLRHFDGKRASQPVELCVLRESSLQKFGFYSPDM